MKTNPNKLWITVVVLGWLFDFLFWRQYPGINFAIFTTACLIGAFYLLLSDGLRPARNSLILLPFFGFFAAVTFIRAEPMTTFLAYTFVLFVMTILAVTYLGGRWMQYTLTDFFTKSFSLLGSMIGRPISFSIEARKAQEEAGIPSKKNNLWPILRGVVIALPIVAIFASLLSSADIVFSNRLEDLINFFKIENLPQLIFRLIYILVIGYGLAGVVLHASSSSQDEKLAGEDKPIVPQFLGFIESSIVLGSVVGLFAFFVVIQFQYFFGGNTNINIEGYTYSEYARKGFGELVAVAFFALMMLLSLSAVTKRETESQRKIYSGMGVALVALVVVMLVSAYQRLGLYEAVYGFSRLRTYTHVFLYWIGLLLIATIVLEILHKEKLFVSAMLIASFGFAMSLPVMNVDAFIVNQNIEREVKGLTDDSVDLDAQYFIDLSDDAVPPLVKAVQDTSLPDSVREKIGASLTCIRHERENSSREYKWQSFHFSRVNADNTLASVGKILDEYKIEEDNYPMMIKTPSGEEFSCWRYYYD